MAPQGQRMGNKLLHQITGLGGNHAQDTSIQSSSSASSPMKSQLASLFHKKEPARVTSPIETPPATLPTGYMSQPGDGGQFSNDGMGGRRFFGTDVGGGRPSMDPGVQAGRFPQSGGFMQQMGQLNNGAMQQTGQLGMGATRITQQGMTQVGQFGRDGLAYAGQGVDSLGQAGSFGQNTVGQATSFGQNTVSQAGQLGQNAMGQAGQLGQNAMGQAGQLGQNAMGQAGQLGQNAMGQTDQLGQNAVSYMREGQFGSDNLGQVPLEAQNPDRVSGLTDSAQVSYGQQVGAAGSYAGATGGVWSEPPTAPIEPQPVTNTSPVRTQAPPAPWMAPKQGDSTDVGSQSRMYYMELLQFFRTQPARHSLLTPSRSSAREKLTRLNKQQFSELSTDVHDELERRQDVQQLLPHLPGRDDFHPKRNQARQKLSTLPKSRFRDLASDVFFELERRYPELPAELRSESLEYLMGGRDAQESTNVPPMPNDSMASAPPTSEAPPTEPPAAVPERASGTERPVSTTLAQRQLAEVMADAQQLTSSQVYVPPRSTAVEEDPNASEVREAEPVPVPSRAPLDPAPLAPPIATERMSDAPPVAEALMEPVPVPAAAAPRVTSAELKAYEEQIAELQQRVRTLEAQEMALRSEGDRSQQQLEELQTRNVALTNRIAQLEQEMEGHVQQTRDLQTEGAQYRSALDDKHAELLQYRADLDDLRRQYDDLHLQHASRAPAAEAEAQWKREIDLMQRNTAEHQRMVQELRDEVASLLDELRRLSARNDAMTADKESDVAIIRDLHQQMSTYKRRFEQAKAELRMMQTTTQLWAQPQAEEWKHMSDRGAIADTNLQAFQSSIDELLSAARSPTPSNVLIAMKTVVLTTTLLTDDVAKFEAQPENMDTLNAQQREDVHSLKLSLSEALSNLMNACRQHASSQGLSPVSLVDAAATHVATAVVELIKLLKLRHVSKPVEDDTSLDTPSDTIGAPSGLKPLHMRGAASPPNVLPRTLPRAAASSPSLRSLSYSHSNLESRMLGIDKQGLSSSPSRSVAVPTNAAVPPVQSATTPRELPSIPVNQNAASLRGPPDESMPDSLLSLPPVSNALPADAQSAVAYGSSVAVPADGPAVHEEETDNWAELRNYIEVQTEAIVHSIQSLLSALREGAQGVQLNENLTQITTIVSSIVAISRDHLPQVSARHPSMATEAERIFADLTENCDRLSDMQSNETFDRSAKSVMASASYGVAKGLKSLNELLNASDEAL
ncbi:component of the polarisome [Malassezia nana]|uniref:Component of the polarisome n=1 Tax=Malassezia nana TaxID=180528 RepID=A0AAF0EQ06_9BASI|nr:component of the polarisome [Malassezia nana]